MSTDTVIGRAARVGIAVLIGAALLSWLLGTVMPLVMLGITVGAFVVIGGITLAIQWVIDGEWWM